MRTWNRKVGGGDLLANKALERTGYDATVWLSLPVMESWFQSGDRFQPVAQLGRSAVIARAMTIQEFPLAWRWTDARYAVFPPDVLAQLCPCSPDEASRLFERAVALSRCEDPTARCISAEGVVNWGHILTFNI